MVDNTEVVEVTMMKYNTEVDNNTKIVNNHMVEEDTKEVSGSKKLGSYQF